MKTKLKRLTTVCAGAFVFAACADLGQRPTPAVQPAQASAAANEAYVLGRSLHMARRFEAATASYMAALKADPRHVNARNGLATLYAEQGEFAKAIPIWQQLTREADGKAGPETAFLFSNLGYAHFLSGEYDHALSALEKACLLDPLNYRAWNHLGSALEKLGQPERAQLMYKQAEALREHDFKADYALAQRAVAPAIEKAVKASARQEEAWATTEVRQLANGMFELHRVPAPTGSRAAEAPAPLPAPVPLEQLAVLPAIATQQKALLEIRNGNGVTGMAKALSTKMDPGSLRVVRLSNQRPFDVRQTRIEYHPAFREAAERLAERFGNAAVVEAGGVKPANMRLVIGRDIAGRDFALKPVAKELPATFVEHQTRPGGSRHNEEDQTLKPGA
ncbi:LytR C-terminal domain-containing protein [Massilia sp. GCM10020059]|uniref:LytR C-terminal domain-containing protein n=1 Tax=Massilia agrisoli TaxID=2892444 RepID=A0ABS8IPZ1_9BURK|nr:LytR C-terminal domain-containing protein [Massilia agrisoli]MCC6070685.1 LytR C-terminal domain-containing protein [Massilia agrisoli]